MSCKLRIAGLYEVVMIEKPMGPKAPGNNPTQEVGSTWSDARQSVANLDDERRALALTQPRKPLNAAQQEASRIASMQFLCPESAREFAATLKKDVFALPNLLAQHIAGPSLVLLDRLSPDGKACAIGLYTHLDTGNSYAISLQYDPKSNQRDVGKSQNVASVRDAVVETIAAIEAGDTSMKDCFKGMRPIAVA